MSYDNGSGRTYDPHILSDVVGTTELTKKGYEDRLIAAIKEHNRPVVLYLLQQKNLSINHDKLALAVDYDDVHIVQDLLNAYTKPYLNHALLKQALDDNNYDIAEVLLNDPRMKSSNAIDTVKEYWGIESPKELPSPKLTVTINFVDSITGNRSQIDTLLINLLKYSQTFIDFFTEFRQYSFDIPFPVLASSMQNVIDYLNKPEIETYVPNINTVEEFSQFIKITNFLQIQVNYGS